MPIFVRRNMDRLGCTMLVSLATNITQDVPCHSICCNASRPGCTMQIFGLRNMDRPGCTMQQISLRMYHASLFVATQVAQDVLCKSSVFATWIAQDVLC